MNFKSLASSFIVLMMFSGLYVIIYDGLETSYNIERDSLDSDGYTIAEKLENLALISAIDKLVSGVYQIVSPKNPRDVLGGLASSATGILQTLGGIIIFPGEIIAILIGFYPGSIPSIIISAITTMIIVYVAFRLLYAYLKVET